MDLNKLHTTEMGADRIKRNLSLDTSDVVKWCKKKISSKKAIIQKSGKNWYVIIDDIIITVNAGNYCIITAHMIKSK